MPKISVIIITLNEEANIERCIRSVLPVADEIVVVDSFSTDRTEEIVRKFNVRFYQNNFLGHIQQKNFALSKSLYPHVLSLDADEALSEQLCESIMEVKNNWNADGYYFNRLTNYCGKWIRYTSWYPSQKLRLWDKTKGNWGGINPHDKVIMQPNATKKYLRGDLLHYSFTSIDQHVRKVNYLSTISARSYYEKGISRSVLRTIFAPLWRFFRDYFLRTGWLDGIDGFMICIISSFETFLKYIKLGKLEEAAVKRPGQICFFNTNKSWGGGEKWHFDIAKRLNDKGYKVFAVTHNRCELLSRFRSSDITAFHLALSNFSFLNPYKLFKIYRIFRKKKVQTVFINLPSDLKVAGLAAKMAGVKNVIYRRGSAIPIRNNFFNRFLFKKIVTSIIANSEETKRTILLNLKNIISENKIRVIYNGIDLATFSEHDSQPVFVKNNYELIIGNAGRLVHQKGQKYLVEIARLLKDKGLKSKILISGEGPLLSDLRQSAKKAGVEDMLVFCGFIEDIKSFLLSIDIFVLTSLWEGFGYVLVEAVQCKKPVVAFNVSSNPEIVKDGETGFLVEPMKPEELYKKIIYLYEHPDVAEKFGSSGKERVNGLFSIDTTVKHVEQLLSLA